jgi:hypothetical protein
MNSLRSLREDISIFNELQVVQSPITEALKSADEIGRCELAQ